MHIDFKFDEVTIAQARFALRLATESMHAAVDAFLRDHRYTARRLTVEVAPIYRVHGRIEAIKYVRNSFTCSLVEGMHVIDSLNDRFGLNNPSLCEVIA